MTPAPGTEAADDDYPVKYVASQGTVDAMLGALLQEMLPKVLMMAVAVAVAILVWSLVSAGPGAAAVYVYLPVALAIAAVCTVLGRGLLARRLRSGLAAWASPGMVIEMDFRPDVLRWRTEVSQTEIDYSALTRVSLRGDFALLRHRGGTYYVVPLIAVPGRTLRLLEPRIPSSRRAKRS